MSPADMYKHDKKLFEKSHKNLSAIEKRIAIKDLSENFQLVQNACLTDLSAKKKKILINDL